MIYIYCPYKGSYGIDVIINQLLPALERNRIPCLLVDKLDGIPTDAVVFPYTMDPAIECLKKGYKPTLFFSMDALTLGYWNKIWFYLKHLNIFHFDFAYSVAAYICFLHKEIKLCKEYKKIVLVSLTDIDYLRRISKQPKDKFIYVANGVKIPDTIKSKTKSNALRLGLLASWGYKQMYQESAWFVKEYFVKYAKSHPGVVLKLIGRGKYIDKLQGLTNVEIVGEVETLNEAFADVDVFIGANPKGCGVLNRVLDAMSFKTPVLALPECFTGLPESENLYYKYTDYKSFEMQVDYLRSHMPEAIEKAERGFKYIQEFNNWEKNYDNFAIKIKEECIDKI